MNARKIVMKIVGVSFSILVIVLVICALMWAGRYAYDFGYRVFTEEAVSEEDGQDITVRIEKGMDSFAIGALLEDKGLIKDGRLFVVQLRLSAYNGKIKPGVYTLNTSMRAREMIQIMATPEKETETETEK